MSGWVWNKSVPLTKRRFFVLLRQGVSSHAAALSVGVSPSCGSLWFIDAGSVKFVDTPTSGRSLSQDDRIEITDELQAGEPVKQIAARIGRSYQSVYREISRGRKPNGVDQPYDAHARAFQQRQRPKEHRVVVDAALRAVITKKIIAVKIQVRWSLSQISRWLRRRWPKRAHWHLCAETIYDAVYRGLIGPVIDQSLRTGRTYRHKRGRGRTREGALKQLTNLKSIHDRPARVEQRCRVGDWESQCSCQAVFSSAVAGST